LNNDGFYLTKYNFGLGEIVARDKYENGEFSSLLVQNMANMILFLAKNGYIVNNNVIVTYVPSLRHPSLVREFAYRVANSLSLPFVDAIIKVNDNEPQKTMQNSAKQLNNVINAFAVNNNCKSFIPSSRKFLCLHIFCRHISLYKSL
jgi:ATP-dependent DNA helicase RecQ